MVPDCPGTMPEINTRSTRYYPEYAGVILPDAPVSDPAMCEGGFSCGGLEEVYTPSSGGWLGLTVVGLIEKAVTCHMS